ncbi:MAG: hypothetical protein KA275_09170 [Chitinophagaceae bacterium]|nr:hypothetical protein [Chitinophagaceae bacterium]
MKLIEQISINEFSEKKFKIKLIEPDNNNSAVITHYLHNKENRISKFYKNDAYKFVKQLLEYKYPETEITNKVVSGMGRERNLVVDNGITNFNKINLN